MNLPPDILHVFAAFARNKVKCLLMGGQACVHYGAAEFSKDIDFTILSDDANLEVLGLRDLVQAKKTQRDKDWPMISRLVEVHYLNHRERSTGAQREFWFRELRNASLLVSLTAKFPNEAAALATGRHAIAAALANEDVERALRAEEQQERVADRAYWEPLKRQLEQLRRQKP
jgi:hypothetical protein